MEGGRRHRLRQSVCLLVAEDGAARRWRAALLFATALTKPAPAVAKGLAATMMMATSMIAVICPSSALGLAHRRTGVGRGLS